jgi:uncharacterized membrane protein (DUF485 family)
MAEYTVVGPQRVRKTWDLILTIILLVLYVGGVVIASFGSAFVLAFWVPLVGMLLTIGIVITGFAIAFAAVPQVAS